MRRIIMTVSVAAITATGAWYGAGLKMKQDAQKVGKVLLFVLEDLRRKHSGGEWKGCLWWMKELPPWGEASGG